jgi:hypothetical protein
MIRLLPILWLGFKIWMIVDANRKRLPHYWFYIIFFIPLGGVAYFFLYKLKDIKFGKIFVRAPSLDEMRYRHKSTPSVENHLGMGQALFEAKKNEEAAACFDEILKRYPENNEALFGAGVSRIELGKYTEAVELLEEVVKSHAAYMDYSAWPELARAQWEGNQRQDSLKTLRKLCRLNSRPDHQLILAQCFIQMELGTDARELLEEALRDHKHSPAYVKKTNRATITRMHQLLKKL